MSSVLIADGPDGPVPVDYRTLPLPTLVDAADAGDPKAAEEIARRVAALA